MGDMLATLRDYPGAEQHYAHAIALRPEDALAHRGLALILDEQNRVGEAIPHYRTVLDQGLEDALVQARLGELLRATGDLDGARTHLERALVLRPGDASATKSLELLRGSASPDSARRDGEVGSRH